jgi:hypothetical protein
VVGIIDEHAALFQEVDVILITVLIKCDEEVSLIAGREDFARPDADLKDRWAAGDGSRLRQALEVRP